MNMAKTFYILTSKPLATSLMNHYKTNGEKKYFNKNGIMK